MVGLEHHLHLSGAVDRFESLRPLSDPAPAAARMKRPMGAPRLLLDCRNQRDEVAVRAGCSALRFAGAFLVLAVAGCSGAPGGPPWVTAMSPDLVALRWYTNQTPVALAGAVAEAHCTSLGKTAVLASDEESGGAQIAQYDCR
jgi:hypothetical protein